MKKTILLSWLFLLPFFIQAQDFSFHWNGTSQTFENGTSNLVSYIDFGEVTLWGYVDITLTGSFNYQNSTGMYSKRYNIGRNLDYVHSNSSEVYAMLGPVATQWKLGEFEVNPSNNHLVIPIYHLVNTANTITVNINGVSQGILLNTSLIQITPPQLIPNTQTRDYTFTREQVAIGTAKADADAQLTVGGKIHAREIQVKVDAGADFVFQPGHTPLNLQATADFIAQNKHLPGIPSAKEMMDSGLEVGKFQIKLLEKIEELTLQLIQQQKEIQELKKQVNKR